MLAGIGQALIEILGGIHFMKKYADSSTKCNSSEFGFGIEEHLMRCSVFQRFSRSMI